jgi:hypothetical protein
MTGSPTVNHPRSLVLERPGTAFGLQDLSKPSVVNTGPDFCDIEYLEKKSHPKAHDLIIQSRETPVSLGRCTFFKDCRLVVPWRPPTRGMVASRGRMIRAYLTTLSQVAKAQHLTLCFKNPQLRDNAAIALEHYCRFDAVDFVQPLIRWDTVWLREDGSWLHLSSACPSSPIPG